MKKMLLGMVCAFIAQTFSMAHAQISFSQQFVNDNIGPGSYTELQYSITNQTGQNASDIAFSNTLPADLTLGNHVSNTCQGDLTAAPGSNNIAFTDGSLVNNQTCQIILSVTSSLVGTHTNTTGDLTSDTGNSGTSSDDLSVTNDRPGISMSFSPSTITLGSPSTLTYVIDNTANAASMYSFQLSQQLPIGLSFESPASVMSTCPGNVVVDYQSQSFSMPFDNNFQNALQAGQTCAININVIGTGNQTIYVKSNDFLATSNPGFQQLNSGFAEATLTVQGQELQVTKSFVDDPTIPGSSVQVDYQINLFNRNDGASGITFTDDFGALVNGTVINSIFNNSCTANVTGNGTGLLNFASGNIAAEGSCQFSVELLTTATATSGLYLSTSSDIDYQLNGQNATSDGASANWTIEPSAVITMNFLTNPISAGSNTLIEYTIQNTSTISDATDITFTHELTDVFPFPVSVTLPTVPDPSCGPGSTMTVIQLNSESQGLQFNNGALAAAPAPDSSCTFTVGIDIPIDFPSGSYLSQTTQIAATIEGATRLGNSASDILGVVAAPQIVMNFIDDPVLPGDVVTVQYQLELGAESPASAADITFTHDLEATLTGLVAVGLPINDACGSGSQLSGTSILTLSAGNLLPGTSCVIDVTLQVPAASPLGTYPSTTSDVSALVSGINTSNIASPDDLQISAVSFSMDIIPGEIVAAEQNVDIEFTIENLDPINDATDLTFTNNLSGTITSWAADGSNPTGVCGAGSQVSGTTFLIFTGGNLLSGTSCTFTVNTTIPVNTITNLYSNLTSNLTATLNGGAIIVDPATGTLDVIDALYFSQQFTNDPVAPGDTVNLEFTIENLSSSSVDGITFTNDLDATLSGLVATGLPSNDVCGNGSQLTGTDTLTLTTGTLAANASCTFNVTIQVPANAPLGNQNTNTTSTVSGAINGNPVNGPASSDELSVFSLQLTKTFQGDVFAGQLATIDFQLINLDSNNIKQDISFSDDLNAMIPGAIAIGLPLNGSCGNTSQLTGTNTILFNQGELPPSGMCQFSVQVQIPANTPANSYVNTTSMVSTSGLLNGNEATASLTVNPIPVFSMQWQPDVIALSQLSQAVFSIDNSGSNIAANQLYFANNLPAGLIVANPTNASTTCSTGSITAPPSGMQIIYSGGTVGPGNVCLVTVDIMAQNPGQFINTSGDLTSNAGNSGTAADTLTVESAPAFNKAFIPNTALVNEVVNLQFTIDNNMGTLAANGLDFVDTFPAGMSVASPSNATTTCTGGTLTAVIGTNSINYSGGSVAAASSCTLSVDVSSTTMGLNPNISGDLTSTLGNSGAATANLTVAGLPVFSKAFSDSEVFIEQETTLTFTVNNSATPSDITGLAFTDNLPAGLTVATPNNLSNTCNGTVNATGALIDLNNGSVLANGNCEISVTVVAQNAGLLVNTTSVLTTDAGNVNAATANIQALDSLAVQKSFSSSQVMVGGVVQVIFSIDNPSNQTITDVIFSDDLDSFIAGAVALNLPQTGFCGGTSSLNGTNIIQVTGATVPANGQCQITVDVQLPAAVTGSFTNTTSTLDFTVNGQNLNGPANSAGSAPIDVIQGGPPAMVPINQWQILLALMMLMLWSAHRSKRQH